MGKNIVLEEKLNELEKLHDLVKENKFREDMVVYLKYGKGYFELWYKMMELFWDIKKTTNHFQLNKLSGILFYHDTLSCINVSRSAAMWIERDEKEHELLLEKGIEIDKEEEYDIIKERSMELEHSLSCIHSFITTKRFDTFYAWERGVYLRYEWNMDKEEYEPVHIVAEKKKGNKEYILANNVFPTLRD